MESQVFHYGKQVLINLIDHVGAEELLEKAFKHQTENLENSNIRCVIKAFLIKNIYINLQTMFLLNKI